MFLRAIREEAARAVIKTSLTNPEFYSHAVLSGTMKVFTHRAADASLAEDISPEITNTQLAEVRRRISQVESGEAALIPGDEAWRECEICPRASALPRCSLSFPELSLVHEHHR